MWKKKEEKKEEKEESLLKELCADDAELYDFLSYYMFINPLTAISKKGLDILTEEAEKSGDFRPAVDKAIFEASQNAGERERYIKVIQNLASKTIHATEKEKGKVEKEGLTDRAAFLGRRIENQKFMSGRAEDIINAASKYYNEIMVVLEENMRREERKEAEREEKRIEDLEKAGRETRKKEKGKMGRKEKREAKKQDKREELEAKERKEERGRESEREEKRIGELEKAGRETRKKERMGT